MFGSVHPEHVVVCPGAQAAIAALILALTGPGDVILAEPTSYPGLRAGSDPVRPAHRAGTRPTSTG
jgi:DNA-binding transcriptional MocR family regulator